VCYPAWRERPIDEVFDRSEEIGAVCPQLTLRFPGRRIYAGDIFSTMLIGTLINMPTVAVRSDLVPRIGNFDESMVAGEDYDFNLRACGAGPVAFIDAPTALYRIGAPDQLTRPSLHFHQARNWFRTVMPFLESGRIPPGLLTRQRDILAGKYSWLGMTELLCGNRRAARAALWQSLRRSPRHAKRWMYFLATFFPSAVEESLRTVYRRIKPRAVK
jgi:GT2 family glycosyltransferase